MKLFVEEKVGGRKTGKKLFLDKVASTKLELLELLGSKDFFIGNERYYINQVQAQKSSDNTAMGMVLGGVLGLIGGAAGVAAGGAIGGLLGKDSDIKAQEKVEKFNGSKL